jgi:hypothetical protein
MRYTCWGVIRHQTGDHSSALQLIDRAIAINPGVAFAHSIAGSRCRTAAFQRGADGSTARLRSSPIWLSFVQPPTCCAN